MRFFVDVSFPFNLGMDQLTYHFEQNGALEIQPGSRVVAPLQNRQLIGYVTGCSEKAPDFKTSPLRELVDPLPLLSPPLVKLGLWMAEAFLCSPGEAFHCMLPGGIKQHVSRFVLPGPTQPEEPIPQELTWLAERGKTVLRSFFEAFPHSQRSIADWTRRGWIAIEHEISRVAGPKIMTRLFLPNDVPLAIERLTPKERQAVEVLLKVNTPMSAAQLARQAEVSSSVIKALLEKGIVQTRQERQLREIAGGAPVPERADAFPQLSSEQNDSLEAIRESARSDRKPVLIRGVTCSGKTEVYLRWVAEEIEAGRDAIVLVPEIALTPQMVTRFRNRFGERVAILHSRLSDGERFDQWEQIRRGTCPVVVGARSAVFAPVPNLGTIILDEEGESSFKQGESPRYHAREVALQRCRLEGAMLVMGSATPSMDTYYLAASGEYRLVEMKKRVASRIPPIVEVVDMRKELVTRNNRSMFSAALTEAMNRVLAAKKQAILFLNRRGFSSFVFCRACGQTLECSRCQVSLVYHEGSRILRCHYCGEARSLPQTCPKCASRAIKYFGAGTQRIEAEARRYFPQARLARLDSDTTGHKGSLEDVLRRFGEREIDILIGTQMVAKGLDFPDVTLVGILAADSLLRLPDFRSAERNFALLSQVAGRAGRGDTPGTVILQTYAPEHHSIRYAITEDYLGFFNEELPHRKETGFPPFRHVASILFQASTPEKSEAAANAFRDRLLSPECSPSPENILGPAQAPIPKINQLFRFQMLLKSVARETLIHAIRFASKAGNPSGVKVSADIDPYFAL
ncbi:primosomal protein N' [bacterium CG2_30_54_10]|nr:MAG: primosomal protein N' [bacterium CG2_30_54_10]